MYKGVGDSSSSGTVIANTTHTLLKNGKIVQKSRIRKLFITDETSRIFHPTQSGHTLIANLILYQMAANNAASQGNAAQFPPAEVTFFRGTSSSDRRRCL
ncbi:uncharacterized protein RCC_10911 [Ramularia collo-cygni]|uniref:Uncharacterized protein n=1 Tax=Ramularia collo-cygni TaxID=112498 RepID=A0A2D3VIG0_9PEZI|nr:uncharacterized protein RCC_10911 [Ramularia collo-cygni]CZT25182.1 uncharacterized protein RCC_10911 [Ramularia collo-cygni]